MSPIFLRGDSIFIPALFVAYTGQVLGEKTPLHRATSAMSNECKKLFGLMNFDVEGAVCNIGLVQELFFVPRDKYYSRQDLQFTGRTPMGKMCARGQEGCGHYMGPINMNGPVLKRMQEIQFECYKLRTRHKQTHEGSPRAGGRAHLWGFASRSAAARRRRRRRRSSSSSSSSTSTMRFCSALTPTPA
jgi:glutamine synthetase